MEKIDLLELAMVEDSILSSEINAGAVCGLGCTGGLACGLWCK